MTTTTAQAGHGPVRTVHQLFEEQARRAPRASAVECGAQRLDYAELDARANRLARHLRTLGLPPGGLVAVSMGRSPELIVALLGVLKAGGAYLPVEPTAPEPALRHILTLAKPFTVVTEEDHRVRLADAVGRPVVCLDTQEPQLAALSDAPLDCAAAPGDLACVFFTSGSTGLPKGALVEHRNLVSAFEGWQEVFRFTPADRHLQSTAFEFDVFTADWLRALCSGGTLVLAEPDFTLDRSADIGELHALVVSSRITVMETNLLTLRRLEAHLRPRGLRLAGVRLLAVGADKWYLDEYLALQEYLGDGVRLVNVYGVAEAGVDNVYFDGRGLRGEVEHPARVSVIGRPFPGTDVYVADLLTGAPAAPGGAGEIRISGPTVGRGYLDDPGSTAACFRTLNRAAPGRLYYRTGDIGRLRPDGLLEFVGRLEPVDGPVQPTRVAKAVGAAEIEGVAREHPRVGESLVAEIGTTAGRRATVVYVVPREQGQPLDTGELRTSFVRGLPTATLDAVVLLPELPRTRAGKVDRARLPLPAQRDYTADGPAVFGPPGSAKARRASGKAGGRAGTGSGSQDKFGCAWLLLVLSFALLALVLTNAIWPGSTDVSAVPAPWSGMFRGLYGFEDLFFGYGVAFLILGRRSLDRLGRPPGLTLAAHLSIVWLLAAWWPQDNTYRLTAADDWAAQAGLVYGFNITLMLAAAVLVRFMTWERGNVGGR
ncbi:AMP-binding protein [Kitasatospora mediocidica]|uniref:AMP-binding protein n=1 Tax=Kitasatospora mediocidica TaxID=58352 RepID=UPI00068BDC09|nr:AMP-binding protein [Kitasatospora mediocidica]